MENKLGVTSYWSGVAGDYRKAHSHGLRGYLRSRELATILELLELKADESVLDAGCGAGVSTAPLIGAGRRITAVDLSPQMVARADELPGVDARVANVETMQLGRTFDKILCSGVFELLSDPSAAMKTLVAHLAPGGRVVVSSPGPPVIGSAFAVYHRFLGNRIYRRSRSQLRRLVETSGLKVVDTRHSGLLWHIASEHGVRLS